jgi:hypothetical protein
LYNCCVDVVQESNPLRFATRSYKINKNTNINNSNLINFKLVINCDDAENLHCQKSSQTKYLQNKKGLAQKLVKFVGEEYLLTAKSLMVVRNLALELQETKEEA